MQGLGELEGAVMAVLWAADGARTVREVHERLVADRVIAYTTVLTVLGNLHGKGWVERERHGRAWVYRPRRTREEAGADALRDVLTESGDPEGVLLHFAREMGDRESAFLRRILDERDRS